MVSETRERKWLKGDVVYSDPCLVTLTENVPEWFRYTVRGWCDTCELEVHLDIAALGKKWKRQGKVGMKTQRYRVTYEWLVSILRDLDLVPPGTEIVEMDVDRERNMLMMNLYNDSFTPEARPEGGERRVHTFRYPNKKK